MKRPIIIATAVISLLAASAPRAEAQTAELPYSINFKEGTEGWTTTDNDGNGATWDAEYYSIYGFVHTGYTSPNEDDLVSPSFALVKGATYRITTLITNTGASGAEDFALMAGPDKDNLTEVAPISVAQTGDNNGVFEYAPEADGIYCFAIRERSENFYYSWIGVASFAVEKTADPVVEAPVAELPYSINFMEGFEGWTITDNDGNGVTWDTEYYSFFGITHNGYTVPNEDDLISPSFALVKGATYTIRTLITDSYVCGPEDFALMAGPDKDNLTEVAPIPVTNNGENHGEFTYVPEADGIYCFAIRERSEGSYFGTIGVASFSIEKTSDPVVETPPADLPYAIDFKESCDGWTAIDNNGDHYSWSTDFLSFYGVYMEGANAPHNDDFISPKFRLSKDKTYSISTVLEVLLPSGEDVITLVGGPDQTAMTEIARLTVSAQGGNSDETDFTPAADGDYCFAFRNTTSGYTSLPTQILAACRFAIAEKAGTTPGALVSTDFSGENPLAGWTVIDANNDGHTWGLTEDLNGIVYNSESAASSSDWLISPLMQLEEGQDYIVEYTLAQAGAFAADQIEVRLGTEATADAMTVVLADEVLEFPNGNGQKTASQRITGMAGGMYCIGFRAATAEPNGTVSLLGVHVTPVEKTVPAPVTNLTASSDADTRTVTLTWTNPGKDTAGAPLQTVDIMIYENGTLVETMTDRTAGADDTYAYAPAEFSGVATYAVTAAVNGAESVAATTSICLDDIQGEKVLVKTISISSGSFSAWTVIDNNGNGASNGGKWVYDMGLYFKHPLGQPTAEDDWAISPSVNLEPDRRYIVEYSLATNANGPATFDVTVGTNRTPEAQTHVIQTQKDLMQNGFGQFTTNQFVVDSEGRHYIGFHVTDVAHSVSISEVSVSYIKPKSDAIDTVEKSAPALTYDRTTAMLTASGDIKAMTVCDAAGRVIVQTAASTADMSAFESGLYIVSVTDSLGHTVATKFVK